jgi:hypothetical protein
MTLNSALRSMAAAARRAERESIRRQREYARQMKQFAKQQEIEQAALEVEQYENRVTLLKSMHQDCSNTWNWKEVNDSPAPGEPTKQNKYERIAVENLNKYEPSIFDKLFRKVDKKISAFKEQITISKNKDEIEYKNNLIKYEAEYKEWTEIRDLSAKILAGDITAYKEAIEQVNPFSEISEIGSSIEFNISNRDLIDITLNVNSSEVIPFEEKTQLKSGKLSIKEMPKAKFYELYQDYVCSCVLRVAREIFALLPLEKAIITAVAELLNTKTGYFETQPILSVLIPKATLDRLNFESIDPSDSMKNFRCNMCFKKTAGFDTVDKIIL